MHAVTYQKACFNILVLKPLIYKTFFVYKTPPSDEHAHFSKHC